MGIRIGGGARMMARGQNGGWGVRMGWRGWEAGLERDVVGQGQGQEAEGQNGVWVESGVWARMGKRGQNGGRGGEGWWARGQNGVEGRGQEGGRGPLYGTLSLSGTPSTICHPIPLSGTHQQSGTPSPYLVPHPRKGYPYINESPKWNSSLLDIFVCGAIS